MEMLDKEINKLKQEYNIVVNEEFFKASPEEGTMPALEGENPIESKVQRAAPSKSTRSA